MSEKDITPLLLHMLAEAYYAGYVESTKEASELISQALYRNKAHRKPAAKISSTMDYTKIYRK